jgi:hypothetical protein
MGPLRSILAPACAGALLFAGCASAQSAPGSESPPVPATPATVDAVDEVDEVDEVDGARTAPAAAPADPAALAALEHAARFQRGETPRTVPRSLHGRFYVGLRDQDGTMIKATVERWYTVSPERMLTTRTEELTRSTSSVGYDGREAWFRDHASGDTVVYTDDPGTFDEDMAQLREQLRLTRLLLDACVLDALIPRLVEPRVSGTRTVEDLDGNVHAVTVVSARVPDEVFGLAPGAPPPAAGDPPPMLALEIGLDQDTGAPWTLAVAIPHRPDLAPLLLRFDFFGRSRDGLRVPGNIRVFRAGEARERMSLGVDSAAGEGDAEWLALDVDVDLPAARFAVPR